MRRIPPSALLLGTAAAVLVLDQLSKAAVRALLPLYHPIWILPGLLALHHVRNEGAAFSLLQGQRIFFIAIALVVLGAMAWTWWRYRPGGVWANVALGLVAGGAAGNLIDRVWLGTVTDFIDPRVFPVFNVADSCIVVGVCMLVLWLLFGQPGASRENGDGGGSEDARGDPGGTPEPGP
jgi:signal peptidase II